VKAKTLKYRSLLLKAHGMYATYRGKALNPEDITVVFADKDEDGNPSVVPMLELLAVVKNIVSKNFIQRAIKRWKNSKN